MGQTYQDKWIYYLPWALLGIRSAFNSDLGTSSIEMTLGMQPQLPGTLLVDPDNATAEDMNVEAMLKRLQMKNDRPAIPTSLNTSNKEVEELPHDVTHVYVKQYDVKGLASKFRGPFPVKSRPSRSTIEVKVGTYKSGAERLELRHISDIKVAHLREDAVIATRPKLGRPQKPRPPVQEESEPPPNNSAPVQEEVVPPKPKQTKRPKPVSNASGTGENKYNLRPRSREIAAINIDLSRPPPGFTKGNSTTRSTHADPHNGPPPIPAFPQKKMWSASAQDLADINLSICTRG